MVKPGGNNYPQMKKKLTMLFVNDLVQFIFDSLQKNKINILDMLRVYRTDKH